MEIKKIAVNETAQQVNEKAEAYLNTLVRTFDSVLGALHLGGRKADYDDAHYEFVGGANDELRKKHYDKSLRLLWKAEQHASWSSFHDLSRDEEMLMQMAGDALNENEKREVERIKTAEFKALLDREYTPAQKQAIVNILSLIGHGEAYAWLVSNEVLRDVKSTGAKAALTMQVLEEAKHFVVLRELIMAFGVDIPRLPVYEYMMLEGTLKSEGLEKFFGMNVLVEGIALSIFGALSKFPGLEVLQMFHLDESRHCALPTNYLKTQPLTWWEKNNPASMVKRFLMVLPAIPLAMKMEKDFAELGIDVFEFGGSLVRKVINLAYRVGFHLPMPQENMKAFVNYMFNAYCSATREGHNFTEFLESESTLGEAELAVEREVFGIAS
ncbi:hypothetical protein [Turneriella parva]|uniref:p-aminobenzoate N-oxygenase AurF n=1 Tax=Turneriella parva (strain ATCC BAA-1111 / DSM 21527 / NCTC 11395 / H) TaxID=869212 RepID=I4BB68_TURPD|nr:hypothetical protein [Turneriella parva]AFM14525.1 hypothetical protein Turpa_3891 [Turneriella parva DSM 21527]